MNMGCPLLALLALAGAAAAQGGQQSAWKPFSPPDEKFTINLPGTPVEGEQSVKTSVGAGEVGMFTVDFKGGERTCLVGYSEVPSGAVKTGPTDRRLGQAKNGIVASVKGKVKSQK